MRTTLSEQIRRDAGLRGPIVVVAEAQLPALRQFCTIAHRHGWVQMEALSLPHATLLAATRDSPFIVLVAATAAWAIDATRALRRCASAPVVVIRGAGRSDRTPEILEAGASLVLDGSEDETELVARIGGVYSVASRPVHERARWLVADGLRVDLFSRRCEIDGDFAELSRTEYALLVYLMQRARRPVPPQDILRDVWRLTDGDGLNTLRIHVGRLRRKLNDSSRRPRYIASRREVGYEFLPAVFELAEENEPGGLEHDVATLTARLDGMRAMIAALASPGSAEQVARHAVDSIVAQSWCDVAALFRHDEQRRVVLVAAAGSSPSWEQTMRAGHALDRAFIGSYAARDGQPKQVADMVTAAKRFPGSAQHMLAERMRSCVVVPMRMGQRCWGDIGFFNRGPRAFEAAEIAQMDLLTGAVSLRLSDAA